jgi:cell division septation protein DedD
MNLNNESPTTENVIYSGFDANVPPSRKYFTEMDKIKVFWIFILCTLVLTFIFIFGYWFGEKNSTLVNFRSNDSVDFTKSLTTDNTSQAMAPLQANDGSNTDLIINNESSTLASANTNSSAPNTNTNESNKGISDQDLSILDNANQDSQTLNKGIKAPTDGNLPSSVLPPEASSVTVLPNTSVPTRRVTIKRNTKVSIKKSVDTNIPKPYVIQLATLASHSSALALIKKLKSKGFKEASVVKKGVLYRVYYGHYSDYAKALKIAPKVKESVRIKDYLILKVK